MNILEKKLIFLQSFFERITKYQRNMILKKINNISIKLYESFIIQSMETMINNIIIPISCPLNDLIIIKNKYSYLKNIQSQQKSTKINYDVYNQLCV